MRVRSSRKKDTVVVELKPRDAGLLDRAGRGRSEFKLKKILVPVDFSECSRKALQYALGFARQFGSEIVLLHVVSPAFVYGEYGVVDLAGVEAEMVKTSDQELEKWVEQEMASGVRFTSRTAQGQIMSEVVDLARDEGIDLIVLSTHGRTGLRHVLLGSVAEQVVRHAPCPVLVVRENEHEFLDQAPRK